MGLRIITRTHYQADEPAFVRDLVLTCASPTASEYPERLASRLERHLKSKGRSFNIAAAKYCVDLAKGLNLLTANNFWTDLGHVLNVIQDAEFDSSGSDLALSRSEQVFFFRLFLEFDGAAILFILRWIEGSGTVPSEGHDWNDIATAMIKSIAEDYLRVSTDYRERTRVRQLLDTRARRGFSGRSGAHQCFVHLQSLMRMGLLVRAPGFRSYSLPTPSISERLTARLRSVVDLEDTLSKNEWQICAAQVFGAERECAYDSVQLIKIGRGIHDRVRETGTPLCSIRTICEAIQVQQIADGEMPMSANRVIEVLRAEQARSPRTIKFDVDRLGRPAFVSFS